MEFFNAFKPGGCALQIVDLLADLKKRFAQHRRIVKNEKNRTNCKRTLPIKPDTHAHSKRVTEREHDAGNRTQSFAHNFGFLHAGKNAVIDPVKPIHSVVACAICADIFKAEQSLFDKTVKTRITFAFSRINGHGNIAREIKNNKSENRKSRQRCAHAPIFAEDENEHTQKKK